MKTAGGNDAEARQHRTQDAIALSMDDRRLLGLWAADCAERVLALFEIAATQDPRPREAIEGIRAFGHGGARTVRLRTEALAALAAARELEAHAPAAAAAARAAGFAAATAYTKALKNPHHAKHALAPAVQAALARAHAAKDEAQSTEMELAWAIQHASAAVREIVGRWPARGSGSSRLSELFYLLDSGLRN